MRSLSTVSQNIRNTLYKVNRRPNHSVKVTSLSIVASFFGAKDERDGPIVENNNDGAKLFEVTKKRCQLL